MKPFDLVNSSLNGTQLIDASAGTGKTYAIAGLFVRLVLETQLQVDQILVVTYTRAATAELKDRILRRLRDARQALTTGSGSDSFINTITQKHRFNGDTLHRIDRAIVDFDRAAIYTIHGFCHKILQDHAFRIGNAYDATLVTDPNPYIDQLAQDFWRIHLYTATPEFIAYLNQKKRIANPQYFADLLTQLPPTKFRIIPDIAKPKHTNLIPYRRAVDRLKYEWQASRDKILALLHQAPLKGNIYGSSQAVGAMPSKREVMIHKMADAMDRFLIHQQVAFPLFGRFEKFTASKLARSVKKSHSPPSHTLFDLCDQLSVLAEHLEQEMDRHVHYLKVKLVAYAREKMTQRKQQDHLFFYDDLLTTFRDALLADHDSTETRLATILRSQYKAALVDEFQDTDTIQYEIFAHLFLDRDVPFFMIGDPKQSIYSFRGADIFSYLNVSKMVDARATLSENWRSSRQLITPVCACGTYWVMARKRSIKPMRLG